MTIVLIAIVLYLAAAGWLVASVQRGGEAARGWLLPANLALLLHGATHYLAWRSSGFTDLHFFAALSLAGLGMAILTAVVGASGRMRALGVVVFPLAAMVLLGYALYGHAAHPEPLDWRLLLHAWLALLSYATLAIASEQTVSLFAEGIAEGGANRTAIIEFLRGELGGDKIAPGDPRLEPALRRAVHLILSSPEYQLG